MTSAARGILLEAKQVSASYGGSTVLHDVDLEVRSSELVGLIGPNGAGKTTFIDVLSGFLEPTAGEVLFHDRPVTHLPPHRRAEQGMGRTFQSVSMFEPLSVEENLMVASQDRQWWSFVADVLAPRRAQHAVVRKLLTELGLIDARHCYAEQISTGQQKLVGLARAVIRKPEVLLLDEPGAGLDRGELTKLSRELRHLSDLGSAILLVDHDVDFVFGICERVYVLDFGRVIAVGSPAQIQADQTVLAAYLGSEIAATGASL